ncbi:MAG: hypothetical protein AB1486_26335 [Planctomycetota bacterium]
MRTLESLEDLRARCQAPMEDFNDPLGRLVGSRISIRLTRLCLALGITANTVSYTMLAAGLAGGLLLVGGGPWAVAGFACLIVYYLLDCVDGEVARFRGETNIEMAAFDYLGHVAVKTLAFAGLAVGLALETSELYPLLFALAALVATLLQKTLGDVPAVLFASKLLNQGDHLDGRVIFAHLKMRLGKGRLGNGASAHAPAPRAEPAQKMPLLAQLRFLVLNFDFTMFLFFAAALVDVLLLPRGGLRLFDLCQINAKAALAVFYGAVLPLSFLDHLATFIRTSRLHQQISTYIDQSGALKQEAEAASETVSREAGD